MAEGDGSERRRAARVKVSVSFAETDPRTITPVSDVSETGAFVLTEHIYPVGAVIQLTFVVLPEEPTVFTARARVVRHSDQPLGMGVEFQTLDDGMRSLVHRLIDRQKNDRTRTSGRGRRRTWSP